MLDVDGKVDNAGVGVKRNDECAEEPAVSPGVVVVPGGAGGGLAGSDTCCVSSEPESEPERACADDAVLAERMCLLTGIGSGTREGGRECVL